MYNNSNIRYSNMSRIPQSAISSQRYKEVRHIPEHQQVAANNVSNVDRPSERITQIQQITQFSMQLSQQEALNNANANQPI